MMIIAIIVTLVCCGLMFYLKREWKAALLVMGAMTLTLVNIPGIPLHNANLLLQAAFLLSEWRDIPRYFNRLRYTPYLWIPLLIVCFSALLAALTSQYVGIAETIKSELLFKYFALAYAFWAVRNEKSLKPILQVSLYCLIVLTVFGVLNYIDKSAMFVNALTEGRTSNIIEGVALGDIYTYSNRFRVQSMFKFAFDYGYICAALLIFHLHGWYRGLEGKIAFAIALACCSFGIMICGCRIVWVSAIFSIACYSMWVFQLSRNVMYGMIAVILLIISYNTVPAVEAKVNQVTDAFIENSETGGSSIQMRMTQYASVLIRIEGNEWLGLGKGYWSYIYNEDRRSVEGILGVESVILQYLLERGIIGLILWATIYSIIFFYFWRNRTKRKALTGLGASTLTLYLVYSIGTGELGSVYPTMLLLGMTMKMIESKKQRLMLYAILLRIMKRKNLTRKQQLIIILKAISK
ncbi:MAG: O-antigen ligase family protein [Prevotella sp.]|nr:O-antigen ligase family protein [Prevotella sp.]